ncbi:MAG: CTP synthase, partial [Fimbriimonadaceae bacterium]|nr:CTP synthase [Fimbriimonadaceae bacterium]
GLEGRESRLSDGKALVDRIKHPTKSCTIAVIGKYTGNGDAYKSIAEALVHAGIAHEAKVHVRWIESDTFEGVEDPSAVLRDVDGVIIAPGFGGRGIEGKIASLKYVRENGVPFLGICLGMQMAVIEYARHVCGLEAANSEEVSAECAHPVIHIIPEQKEITEKGATMRLGSCPCNITAGSLAHLLYGETRIEERHRHRYEVNNDYRETLIEKGLIISGVSPDYRLVEMVELPTEVHPFFIGTQAHPEFKSRPNRAHPLFQGLVKAAVAHAGMVGRS